MRSLRKTFTHLNLTYLALPAGLICVYLLYLFQGQAIIQVQLVVCAAIIYVALALLHHYKDKTLTAEIIIEYILIAIFAVILISGFLL